MDAAPGDHDRAISFIDPQSGRLLDFVSTGSGFGYVRNVMIVGDELWWTDADLSALLRVWWPDALTSAGLTTNRITPIGERIEGAVVAGDKILVTINPFDERSAVVAVDPRTGSMAKAVSPAGAAPASTVGLGQVAAAAGSIWIAADWPDLRAVLRIDPPG